ncbi:MAG: hypothetical protein ACOCV1_05810 [Bacillota bacterium]
MKIFYIYSVPRSGHHAIINWIVSQLDRKTIFLNNCSFIDGFLRPRQFSVCDSNSLGEVNPCDFLKFKEDDRFLIYFQKKKVFNSSLSKLGIHNIIMSSEIEDLNNICQFKIEEKINAKEIKKTYHICIQRDFKNWISSVLSHVFFKSFTNEEISEMIALWEKISNAYFDENKYFIKYNKWFLSEEYKRQICSDLDISFNDKFINNVASYGKGSSFDYYDYNGKAQQMDVLNRYKKMENNPRYKDFLELYQHLIPLSNHIFNK